MDLIVPASIMPAGPQVSPVAIVGMAGLFPEAATLREFWDNVVRGRDCIRDVPASRWDLADYYDADPSAPDKTYSKRGGFIPDVAFDPLEWGLPPNSLEVTDVAQLLSLLVAKKALDDAGYGSATGPAGSSEAFGHAGAVSGRALDRERTGVILGVGGGQKLITPLTARLQYPVWERVLVSSGLSPEDARAIAEKIKLAYVPWEENSFPGMLGNVIAGRIANRLDLGGMNCVVDAACASSLAALRLSLAELNDRQADVMITGGVDADNSIFMYMCFSKTPAFSRSNQVRPFDAQSDGMMVGEGIGMLVLKRLDDAERDGDRIYAVIRGVGTSSDGRFKSIYAPRSEGQARALRRAYRNAGVEPSTVGLIEAHGTGTVAGDLVETTTLDLVFREAETASGRVALGSVKSQIGHTKSAAGVAGMIKAALALHHKVLPPTINVTEPHPALALADSPLYVNTHARPWMRQGGAPRRAGVSSFGFGGTNYHVVLEEYAAEQRGAYRLHAGAPPMVLAAPDRRSLAARVRELLTGIEHPDAAGDGEARRRLYVAAGEWSSTPIPVDYARLGFVAETLADARSLLATALGQLESREEDEWEHPKGIFFRQRGATSEEKVVALFPGQGSQYVDMGRELACAFPDVREAFAAADAQCEADGQPLLSEVVYPVPAFTDGARDVQTQTLQRTEHAQPAIGVLSMGLFRLVQRLGLKPDFAAGHSFGELTALWAGGALSDGDFLALARARGKAMAPPPVAGFDAGAMLSVRADEARVGAILAGDPGLRDVRVANVNSPQQTVVAGPTAAVAAAQTALTAQGVATISLPVSAAFHTSLVGHAQSAFAAAVAAADVRALEFPVYSNASGGAHDGAAPAVRAALVEHLLQPVKFQREIERLYEAGARIFVEIGPRSVLTNLVGEILIGRPHEAVALNASRQREGERQFWEGLVRLRVAGLFLDVRDPYLAEELARPARPLSGAAVRLNGSNYVSDKTRQTFHSALQDGHRVAPVERIPQPPPLPPRTMQAQHPPTPLHPGSTMSQTSHSAAAPVAAAATQILGTQPVPVPVGVIERGVAAFGQHQSEGLRAHQQYLEQQAEQNRTFLQFMQQQQQLLLSPGGVAVPQEAHEALARSLALYQELQVETARSHQFFLQQHAEHSRSFVELLRQPASGKPLAPAFGTPQVVPLSLAPAAPAAPEAPAALRAAQAPAPPAPVATRVETPAPVVAIATPIQPAVPTHVLAIGSPVATAAVTPPTPAMPFVAIAPETALTMEEVTQALLAVVSDKTGYPAETLELDMDIEADLGIDSIKRVEILGTMRTQFPGASVPKPADLAELRTLQQIVDFLRAHGEETPAAGAGTQGPAGAPAMPASNGALSSGSPTNGAVTDDLPTNGLATTGVPWTGVRLRALPLPDALDTAPPAGTTCLIADDGTPLTAVLVRLLKGIGWSVAVLAMPEEASEDELRRGLEASHGGTPGVFIHLSRPGGVNGLFNRESRSSAKKAFLLAKLLMEPLNAAASAGNGRAAFMAVTRLDGALGSGLQDGRGGAGAAEPPFDAEGGAVYGLVKTLKLEWPAVYCRAIDLSPTLDLDEAARLVLAEYLDPDWLVSEVGHGAGGRVTLAPAEPLGTAR